MKIETLLASKGPKVFTARPNQTVREVTQLLAQHNVGALVVMDEAEALVGIVSERDVVRAIARGEAILDQPVSELMTRKLVVGSPQDDLSSVMQTMTERRFRHLPIVEGGRLVGMISIGDVVKAQLTRYQGEVETLQTQIIEQGS
jgi:CBS domain-containing protein